MKKIEGRVARRLGLEVKPKKKIKSISKLKKVKSLSKWKKELDC